MEESKLQSGYIESLEKTYIFTYDGELLQLVPKEKVSIKAYDSLRNKNIYESILEGVTINKERIFFLNCNLQVNSSGYFAKPAGFVCFQNGERTFDTLTFSGGIINYFYRQNHIIDIENTQYDYIDGGGAIKLKSFDDVSKECTVEILGKKAMLLLSVSLPAEPIYMQVDYNLGKPNSILRLTFDEEIDISMFRDVYMWIYNLMAFVNFRKSVNMGDIYLGNHNSKKQIERVAYVYLNQINKEDIINVNQIIGYYFVFDHINKLMKNINKGNLNLLLIPTNFKNDQKLSPEKYIICCTSFESVFHFCFPEAEREYKQKRNEVKEEFLQYISDKREEYKGIDRKKRNYFQKYAELIEKQDFSLEEKFDFCLSQYEEIINNYKQMIAEKYNIDESQYNCLAHLFAKKRNDLMHSVVEPFEDIHIYAYILARVFVYIMLLSKAEIEKGMIIQAIELIF